MIGFLANTIGRWQLGKKLEKFQRKSEALNLSEMNSAVVVFDLLNKEAYLKVVDFVKQLKAENVKSVEMLGFSLEKEEPQYINKSLVNVMGKEQINLFGIPNENFSGAIIDRNFDLMVDFTESNNIPTDYLLGLINAKTKVGSPQKDRDDYFDLLVDINNEGMEVYGKNVVHFLKMINKQ